MTRRARSAWDAAMATVVRLRDAGHTALLAGGCVRDMLLSHAPKDYDVATDAVPARVLELFPRSREVGAKFGVVLTRKFGHEVEVATFRSDGTYSDGRRPDSVTFGSAEQDALRRDFTINGLFYDPIDAHVIDHVGGRADIEAGIVRTIGDPSLRFEEDHLRMLRALRFAATLEFTIDPPTLDAIRAHAPRLAAISPERVWMELEKMLSAPSRATGWSLMVATKLCDHLAAGWTLDAANHPLILRRLAELPATAELDATVGLTAILLDDAEGAAKRVSRALKLSNRQRDSVAWLVRSVPAMDAAPDMELADLKMLMAHALWASAIILLRADLRARHVDDQPLHTLVERARRIPSERVVPPPLLAGDDLMSLGIQPGPRFGAILKSVYRAQLNEVVQTPDDAQRLARDLMRHG